MVTPEDMKANAEYFKMADHVDSLVHIPKTYSQSINTTAEQDTSPKEENAVINHDTIPVQEVSAFMDEIQEPAHDKVPVSELGIDIDIVGNFLASKRRIKALKKELAKEEKLHHAYAEGIFVKLTELGDYSEEDDCDWAGSDDHSTKERMPITTSKLKNIKANYIKELQHTN